MHKGKAATSQQPKDRFKKYRPEQNLQGSSKRY